MRIKKKIVGILVCTLLIVATVLPVAGMMNVSKTDVDEERDNLTPVSRFKYNECSCSQSQWGEVKFIAHVVTNESSGDIPICYGAPHCNVRITRILYDPQNLLVFPSNLSVCYNKTRVQPSVNLTVCCTIEVYGIYWKTTGPMQYVGHVTAMSEPHYVRIIEEIPPKVEITKPLTGYLYIGNRQIGFIGCTVIIGPITIEVDASDECSGMDRVEFFIDVPPLRYTDNVSPYNWTWFDWYMFPPYQHIITVIAYDNASNSNSAGIRVFKFL